MQYPKLNDYIPESDSFEATKDELLSWFADRCAIYDRRVNEILEEIEMGLRQWRINEAVHRGINIHDVVSEETINLIMNVKPQSQEELNHHVKDCDDVLVWPVISAFGKATYRNNEEKLRHYSSIMLTVHNWKPEIKEE